MSHRGERDAGAGGTFAACLLVAACTACSPPSGSPAAADYRPTSTVKDIMDAVIDPSADFVWDSVQIVATLQGTEEHAPRTDDDWKAVRRHTVALVEASNLLLIPGRHIARPGEKADDPKVDLPPEEIEKLMLADWPAWVARAHALHEASTETLKAVEARDVKALLSAGEVLDAACESCHRKYWYPSLSGSGSGEASPSGGPGAR
jgi:hypothetical protein